MYTFTEVFGSIARYSILIIIYKCDGLIYTLLLKQEYVFQKRTEINVCLSIDSYKNTTHFLRFDVSTAPNNIQYNNGFI